jgi:hypothetical protein
MESATNTARAINLWPGQLESTRASFARERLASRSAVHHGHTVRNWPISTQIDVGSHVGYRGPSRIVANEPNPTLVTQSGHLRPLARSTG